MSVSNSNELDAWREQMVFLKNVNAIRKYVRAEIVSGIFDVLTVSQYEVDVRESQKRSGYKSSKIRLVAMEVN